MRNKFTDTEIKVLLKNLVIIIDTREQVNNHITKYFESNNRNIKHISKKLDFGDYSVKIESNKETKGIIGERDIYFDDEICIERKNSVDELSQSIKDRDRFSNEFDRLSRKNCRVVMMIEDVNGLQNIVKGNYRSQYQPKAFYASLKTFEYRYGFTTSFVDKNYIGMEIYNTLKYYVREKLK